MYRNQLNHAAADTYTHLYLSQRKVSLQLSSNGDNRKGPTLDHIDSEGYTPLVSAIRKQIISDVDYLLINGADPSYECKEKSPLMFAIDSGNGLIIEKIISALTCDQKLPAVDVSSILRYAVAEGALGAIAPLCRSGADIETSLNGYTPLLYAAKLKRIDLVRVLCKNGANVHARCKDEFTALHHAIMRTHTGAISGRPADVVRALLEKGGDPNAKDKEGKTPLHHAVALKDEVSAKTLLERYSAISPAIDLEIQDNQGRTALIYALMKPQRCYKLVKLLLDNGATRPETVPKDLSHDIKHLLDAAKQRHATASSRSNSSASVDTSPIGNRKHFRLSPFRKSSQHSP